MYEFDIRPLQHAELKILKDVVKLCEQYNIDYMLESGTVLGAIRHGGFIPWNDDIDICMDAKNYRKFRKIAVKFLPGQYFVQNYRTDNNTPIRWTKIRMNNTTALEYPRCNTHQGIFIDVFSISGLSNNKVISNCQKKAYYLFKRISSSNLQKSNNEMATSRSSKIIWMLPECIRQLLLRILESLWLQGLNNCDAYLNSYSLDSIFPTKLYKNKIKVKFEDKEYWVPEEFDTYLTLKYGDWRIIPDEKDRMTHNFQIVDLNNGYEKYLKLGD